MNVFMLCFAQLLNKYCLNQCQSAMETCAGTGGLSDDRTTEVLLYPTPIVLCRDIEPLSC